MKALLVCVLAFGLCFMFEVIHQAFTLETVCVPVQVNLSAKYRVYKQDTIQSEPFLIKRIYYKER